MNTKDTEVTGEERKAATSYESQLLAASYWPLAKGNGEGKNQPKDPSTPVSIAGESAMDPPALRIKKKLLASGY